MCIRGITRKRSTITSAALAFSNGGGGGLDTVGYGANNTGRELVLHIEELIKFAVKAIGPEMLAGGSAYS